MAEESIDTLVVTREKNGLESRDMSENSAANSESLSNGHSTHIHPGRASIGSYHVGDSSTRNSSEKSDSVKSVQNVVPHYLRASTGSCHDLCKYGGKHSFEKAKKPIRRRIAKSLSSDQYSVQIFVSGDRKKEKVVEEIPETVTKNHLPDINPSPDTKSYSRDPKHPKTSLDKEKTTKNQPVMDIKIRSLDLPSSGMKSEKTRSSDLPSPGTKSYSSKPKTSLDKGKIVKHKTPTDTRNHSPQLPSLTKSYVLKPKMSSDFKTFSPRKTSSGNSKTILPKCRTSTTQNVASPDPPEFVKSVSFPSRKVEGPVKQDSSTDNKMSRPEKKTTYLSKQHPAAVKSKPVKLKPSSSSDYSDGTRGKGRRNDSVESDQTMRASNTLAKKLRTPTNAASSPKLSVIKTAYNISGRARNPILVSPLKVQNRIRRIVKTKTTNNQKVPEKTLHVIKTETENNDGRAISSLPSTSAAKSLSRGKTPSISSYEEEDNTETEYSGDGLISDGNESLEIGKVPHVKENLLKKSLKKSRVVVSEEKSSSPVKLKFRSGKIVDLQSENNGPRKLRFRRARIVGAEEGKGALRRRILKKAGLNDGAAAGAELSSEKVILKHQDVQDKKDSQGLFNNVIEETASKLVESRISKVKALVGAFETVISLQETKPSLQAIG